METQTIITANILSNLPKFCIIWLEYCFILFIFLSNTYTIPSFVDVPKVAHIWWLAEVWRNRHHGEPREPALWTSGSRIHGNHFALGDPVCQQIWHDYKGNQSQTKLICRWLSQIYISLGSNWNGVRISQIILLLIVYM